MNHDTRGWPLRTKAGLVTFTVTSFLRISTWACSPISRGTRARRCCKPRVGEKGAGSDHPFTHFACFAGEGDRHAAAQHAFSSITRPTSLG